MAKKNLLKRVGTIILSAVMLLTLFAGCGGKKVSAAAGDTNGASQLETGTDADSKTFVYAGNISINYVAWYSAANGQFDFSYPLLYSDALIDTDHAGTMTPALATEWEWNEDYTEWKVTLRDGVTFQNGVPFTAEAVKFNYDLLISNEINYRDASKWVDLKSVEVVDDLHCVFHFENPFVNWEELIFSIKIVEPSAYREDPKKAENYPVGTGPWQVTDFAMGQYIVFERNDAWWGWTEENKSNVDKIKYVYSGEETSRISALRTGEFDLIEYVPLDNIDVLESEGFHCETYDRYDKVYLGFQCDGVFSDKNLREAVSLCIDRQLIVDSILGGGTVANWGCIEGARGWVEEAKNYKYEYDPERAATLVKESSYKGQPICLIISTGSIVKSTETVQAIVSMMTQVGFNVKVESLENATFQSRRKAGDYDIHFSAISNVLGNTSNEVGSALTGNRFADNWSIHNEEMQKLREVVLYGLDPKEREQATADIYKIILTEFAPTIWLYNIEGCTAYKESVSGVTQYKDGYVDLRYVEVAD